MAPIITAQQTLLVAFNITRAPKQSYPVHINIKPAIPQFPLEVLTTVATVNMIPVDLHLRDAINAQMAQLLVGRMESFFDDARQLKTLLNFGDDYQSLITNWIYDPADSSGTTILVKLYEKLPDAIDVKTKLWISRELSPPLVDKLFVDIAPDLGPQRYLRPPNRNITVAGLSGASVVNATLSNQLSSGSFDPVMPSDPVVEEWYSHDFNQSELNVDYSDYRNFVFFGSAASRLSAFIEKLVEIENFTQVLNFNSASLAGTGSGYITGSSAYTAIQSIADQRTEMIRSFDPYERFLYYETEVPYSASLNTNDAQDAIYFNSDATWPKFSGSVAPVASSSIWITAQMAIAAAYDTANQDYFGNNLPAYLQSDADSTEFFKFVDLVGHQFDTLKLYIDHMKQIYDRDSDPSVGMSPDVVWNVGQSFGIDFPNPYAIKQIVDYTVGEDQIPSPKIYRQAAAETWKRFLHNQIFMMKTKGTKQSLQALVNTYGILPTTLQIRESATPGPAYPSGTFELYEEQTNVLTVPKGSFIKIPWSGSLAANTVEIRFATTEPTSSVLLNADTIWALTLDPISGSYGVVSLRSGSGATVITKSSPFQVYSGDYYSLMMRNNGAGMQLYVENASDGTIEFSSRTQETSSAAPVTDGFHRANNAATLGNADSGQIYTVFGTFGIFNNQAYTTTFGGNYWAVVPAFANGSMTSSITTSPTPTSASLGLAFRHTDDQNHLIVDITNVAGINPLRLYKKMNGSYTSLAESTTPIFAANTTYTLSVSMEGPVIKMFVNGIQYLTYTLSIAEQAVFTTAKNIGLWIGANSTNDDGGSRWNSLIANPDLNNTSVLSPIFNAVSASFLGGSGSTVFGRSFNGFIDEFRIWSESLFDTTFDLHVQYPGLYNGNTPISSRIALPVRLSFNKPLNLFAAPSISNESPYIRNTGVSASLLSFPAINFPNISTFPYNMTTITRQVLRYSPNAGASQYTTNKVVIADPPQLLYLNATSSIPVLYTDKSIVSLTDKQDNNRNTNLVGFYFSITDAINDSIIRSIGNIDLQNLIGDPGDLYSGSYGALETLNNLYWTNYAYNYNPNSFVDFVRNILDPLFTQAKELVPARAKLLSGIVHEPHILERAKIQHNPVEFTAGAYTKHNTDTYNLEPPAIEMQTTRSLSGETDFVDWMLTATGSTATPSAEVDYQETVIDVGTGSFFVPSGEFDVYETSIGPISQFYMASSSLAINLYTDTGSLIGQDLGPFSDFTHVESYTYFSNLFGLVPVYVTVPVLSNSSVLNNRGNWAPYSTYNLYDYVTQTGSVADGDGKLFICTSTDMNFFSALPPAIDTSNWRPVQYVPTAVRQIRQAILVNGSASIAPTGSGFPIITGYLPQHYRFTRDMRTGTLNHQWKGCLQTDDTTSDGRPAVEVTFTEGNTLVVRDPATPIQPTDNITGPILDVQ